MEEKHKQLRSICRDMGPRLPEIIAWYRALPEEKQPEWNYPVIVWREFQNAHRPTPTTEPRRTKHEETVHELEQRHAATVTALHAENAELKTQHTALQTAVENVEELVRRIVAKGKDAIKRARHLLEAADDA